MLNSVLTSPICDVNFAGFKSNTYALQQSGWDLSVERAADRDSIRIAMRHSSSGLYALSSYLDYYHMGHLRSGRSPLSTCFDIVWVGTHGRFHIIPEVRYGSFWKPFDAKPFIEDAVYKEVAFEDMIPFRTVNPEAPEIVVHPSSVPELMELILKIQDPTQKEIRERQRLERAREGRIESRPSDIRAQIISLAG